MTPTNPQRHCYDYPRPSLTVDAILLRIGSQGAPEVLLIERRSPPFAGHWALPGGFVDQGERLEQAARRELLEETGLEAGALHQLATFADPGRDPRGWTASVVFHGWAIEGHDHAQASDDAARAEWFRIDHLPEMAFDHRAILGLAFERNVHARP